jgi:hypothetical protein
MMIGWLFVLGFVCLYLAPLVVAGILVRRS